MRRAALLVVAVAVLVFAMSGVASAATPQDIYNDYAADHVLNGTYTDAELQAYLDDATARQYFPHEDLTALDVIVLAQLNEDRNEFPFTGAQLALLAIVAMALVGGGVALSRLARSRG